MHRASRTSCKSFVFVSIPSWFMFLRKVESTRLTIVMLSGSRIVLPLTSIGPIGSYPPHPYLLLTLTATRSSHSSEPQLPQQQSAQSRWTTHRLCCWSVHRSLRCKRKACYC